MKKYLFSLPACALYVVLTLLGIAIMRHHPAAPPTGPLDATTAAEQIRDGVAGYTVTILDTVAAVHQSDKGQWYLSFGGRYPDHILSVWVPKSYTKAGKRAWFASLEGQRVKVTGQARLYKSRPEIVVNNLDTIQPADESVAATETTAHIAPTKLAIP